MVFFLPCAFADQFQDKPFAVVELFSSEGCSSCPPADALVSKLVAWARQNNEAVYPLIFHVDYWNYLGWQDHFSRPEFSQRQRNYSNVLSGHGVYTPQMIVNGKDGFVGSDQEHLQNDLNRELTIPASVVLKISEITQNGQVIVNYSVDGTSKDDVVNIALVERGLSSDVTAGENAGCKLFHDNVVREFLVMPATKNISQEKIPLQKISNLKNCSLIVFVQNTQSMFIETAKQLDL